NEGIAPWARREGPSMAQRGYPGIHAGMPTAQCLRSASVVNGAPKIKSQSKAKARHIQNLCSCTTAIESKLAPTFNLQ
ncbi:hypothetical protein, partial [Pseudomonas ogarae]|uniref:hypothetical protein n=2 Tax=Pseudomonas ogarae (strain DSM 112162 / CECT 30235 / F113) TaxID=1114970 RepID=UPI001C0F19DE